MAKAEDSAEPHSIRLRAAWEYVAEGARVSLPADWPIDLVSPFQISRRFNAPKIDPQLEITRLRFDSVPGLLHASLNGVELFIDPSSSMACTVSLEQKNLLILTIDPSVWRDRLDLALDWGHIALEIHKLSLHKS